MKYKVTRDVTTEECHWLDSDVKEGTEVYEFIGHTYGCITPSGIAVSLVDGERQFFELPAEAMGALG